MAGNVPRMKANRPPFRPQPTLHQHIARSNRAPQASSNATLK
jgi:hypothetical protein